MKDALRLFSKVFCPHCKAQRAITHEDISGLNEVGKAVAECNKCGKLFVIRNDQDGVFFAT